jgi:hypothetical protein
MIMSVGSRAAAQVQRSALESLQVSPPPHPYNLTNDFSVHSVVAQTVTGYALNLSNQNGDDPNNLAYFNFTGLPGSSILIWPLFADPIPNPSATSDACHHSHLGWAVYEVGYLYISSPPYLLPVSFPLSSTGELGRRVNASSVEVPDMTPGAQCVIEPNPDTLYPSFTGSSDWGSIPATARFGWVGPFYFTNVVVVAQAATHGWGSCDHFLCFPGVTMIAIRQ